MNIKTFYTAVISTLIATPVFAHPGDHGASTISDMIAHLFESSFHVGSFIVGAIVIAAIAIWRKRQLPNG